MTATLPYRRNHAAEDRPVSSINWHRTVKHLLAQDTPAGLRPVRTFFTSNQAVTTIAACRRSGAKMLLSRWFGELLDAGCHVDGFGGELAAVADVSLTTYRTAATIGRVTQRQRGNSWDIAIDWTPTARRNCLRWTGVASAG